MTKALTDDYYPEDLEPVPTVPDLATRGLARVAEATRQGTRYEITPEGREILNAVMARNAARTAEHHQNRRTPREDQTDR